MPAGDRLENLRALRIANFDLAFATMFGALVAGNFYSEFIIRLTPDSRLRAFIFALSALLGVLQIPGSILGQRFPRYKKYVGVGGFFWRFWWIPIAFLPLMPAHWPRLEIFLSCVALQAISIFMIQPTYNEWLTKLVPVSHRAWYFSRRAAYAVAFAAVVGFPASRFMDFMRARGQTDLGLCITFSAGVLLGFVSFYFFMRMPDTVRDPEPAESHQPKSLLVALEHKPLRRLLIFLAVFTVGQTVAAPFFFPYAREVLNLNLLTLQLLAACMAIASVASARLWRYLGEKYGNKPILFIAGVLIFGGPACWALTYPGKDVWNISILVLGHICAGVAWTGVNAGQFNFTLAVTKPEHRAQALGLTQAVSAVVSGIAPLAAGYWLNAVSGESPSRTFYVALFAANAAIRLVAVLFLIGIVDPSSSSIRGFLRQVAGVRPRGVLAMKNLQKAASAQEKQRAVRTLGESKMTFAETEVAQLLNDPSPIVRREAAMALSKFGGEEAVAALTNLIQKNPHAVDEEMIEALAALDDESAVPALVSLLQNPSSALRRSSARALGKLRSRKALGPLMEAASNTEDAELRRAAIQALRLVGDPVCEPVISWALHDAYPSVRIAAAEACAELKLASAADSLRTLLKEKPDESSAELAYALGSVGNEHDLQTLLCVARQMDSSVARRRCLLAAARLLNVEREFYRFLLFDPVSRDELFLEFAAADKRGVFRRAISLYHSGKEEDALALLARKLNDHRIAIISECGPKEGFLLAITLLRQSRLSS